MKTLLLILLLLNNIKPSETNISSQIPEPTNEEKSVSKPSGILYDRFLVSDPAESPESEDTLSARSTPTKLVAAIDLAAAQALNTAASGLKNEFKDFTKKNEESWKDLVLPHVKQQQMFQAFALEKPSTVLEKLKKKPDDVTLIYPVQHVFQGSGGGGKHFIGTDLPESVGKTEAEILLNDADLTNEDLPFVRNNDSNQLMGMVYVNKATGKNKLSTIFPFGSIKEEIHAKLLSLDFKKPYAFGKSFHKNILIMKTTDEKDNFIIIDLSQFRDLRIPNLLFTDSIYPLFNLRKIKKHELLPESSINLLNYSLLEASGQWSEQRTATMTIAELTDFLYHVLSNSDNFKQYVIGCSRDGILIKIPYNFVDNIIFDYKDMVVDLDKNEEKIRKNRMMYAITIEIPKSIAGFYNSEIKSFCSSLEHNVFLNESYYQGW